MALLGSRARSFFVLIVLVIACAAVFSLVYVQDTSDTPNAIPSSSFISAHTSLQLLSISVSLSVFGIRWTSARLTRSLDGLLIGAAFLSVGVFHLFHVLSYPGLLESLPLTSSNASIHFHVIARLVLVVALLVTAFLKFKRKAEPSDPIFITMGTIVFVLVIFYVVGFQGSSLPTVYSESGSLTSHGKFLEYTGAFLFGLAALVYSHRGWVRGQLTDFRVAAALVVGLFGQLSFSINRLEYDLANLVAYSFEFTSFLVLFLALLRESVAAPFEKLGLTEKVHWKDQTRLELKTKQLEEATLRAQAHLDFFAHDVSNIISPIASYAEMLLAGSDLTPQQRTYLNTILRQAQRGGTFVASLRRLANAEAVTPGAFVGVDLGRAITEMEEAVKSLHPSKVISTTLALPVDTEAIVPGGEHIEGVLYEILKNAVEDVREGPVRLSIECKLIKDDHGEHNWQVSITQFGHRFPADILAEARVIYDPRRGIGRGIASTYSFCASIVSHFGGRMWIENLPETGNSQDSRVTIELPTADTMMAMSENDQE